MIDMQLIHEALAAIGIAVAAAALVAVMIIALAAGLRDRRQHHAGTPVTAGPLGAGSTGGPREPALR